MTWVVGASCSTIALSWLAFCLPTAALAWSTKRRTAGSSSSATTVIPSTASGTSRQRTRSRSQFKLAVLIRNNVERSGHREAKRIGLLQLLGFDNGGLQAGPPPVLRFAHDVDLALRFVSDLVNLHAGQLLL